MFDKIKTYLQRKLGLFKCRLLQYEHYENCPYKSVLVFYPFTKRRRCMIVESEQPLDEIDPHFINNKYLHARFSNWVPCKTVYREYYAKHYIPEGEK